MDNKKIIRMCPKDSFSLFWDEEGVCIGSAESLTLHDSSDDENGTTIELHIPALQEWLDEYMWQCLVPCESGKISIEELNKSFNWKKFHKQGVSLALEVKKLLPPDVSLLYDPPFEDKSGIMFGDTKIEDWKWCLVGNIVREREYGENHEIRIGTKHFSPGTKIYCAPGHWGDGYENIVVIGKQRESPKYIEIIMPRRFIENFRCQKVFRPAVLRLMNKSHWGFWSNSDSAKEAITEMAKGLNNPSQDGGKKMEYDTKENKQSALLLLPPDSVMDPEGIKALRKMQSISEANGNNNLSLDEINEEIRAARLDGDLRYDSNRKI